MEFRFPVGQISATRLKREQTQVREVTDKQRTRTRRAEDVVGFETVSGRVNMSVFVRILAGLDGLDLLTDLERGAESKFHGHQEVVVSDQTQRSAVNFVFHELVDVGLIAESREKVSHVIDCPFIQRSAIGVSVH